MESIETVELQCKSRCSQMAVGMAAFRSSAVYSRQFKLRKDWTKQFLTAQHFIAFICRIF